MRELNSFELNSINGGDFWDDLKNAAYVTVRTVTRNPVLGLAAEAYVGLYGYVSKKMSSDDWNPYTFGS